MHPEEFVDDSEPERAEMRAVQRRYRPQSSTSKKPMIVKKAAMSRSIVDFTDSGANDCGVIEISDSDSSTIKVPSRRMETNSASFPKHLPALPLASGSGILPSGIVASETSEAKSYTQRRPTVALCDDGDDRTTKTLNLKQFAFAKPTSNKGKATVAQRKLHTAATSLQVAPRRALDTDPKFEISNSDLTKIVQCVSCDVAWTTRKTGVQKMMHIKSCAKKHAFDDDTIQTLVRKAIASYVPSIAQGKGKGKESTPMDPSSQNTFLENVLVDAAPRKRVKRQQAVTLLVDTSASRDDILARAQKILSAATLDEFARSPTAKDHTETDLSDNLRLSTQVFGQSTLAQKMHGTTANTLFSAIYSSPPSRLGSSDTPSRTPTRKVKSKQTDASSYESWDIDVQSDITPHQDDGAFGSMEHLLYALPTNVMPQELKGKEKKLLDIDTKERTKSPPEIAPRQVMRKTKPKIRAHSQNAVSDCEIEPTPKITARTKKPKPPKKTKIVYTFDDEWETHMKNHIVQDKDLHMRILRYEPIHFNVFLDLAKLYAPDSNKLKFALQKYLDDQAIQSYDDARHR